MPYSNKILAFEFVLNELMDWHKELTGNETKNDFSILKSLKLLFFVSAARTNSSNHSVLLEDVFTNYVAMPYGHVESDVYAYLREARGEL
ncbi:MAG TPA: hypothetical protein PKL15_10175, partial [Saprospiraceae bacterium]|nr:hypothetical protein [Saprospiraceae bacterium]